MRVQVVVKPNARRESAELQLDGSYKVAVKAPAHGGLANERLVELLAEFFDVPKSGVVIVRGHTSRKKLVEVAGLSDGRS